MKKERYFWGALFILAGIFLVVSKLGYLPDINVFSLLLTAFLGAVIVKSIPRLNYAGILFPLAFIAIIYDKELGITAITPWTVLLAALLGSIGLSIIFHRQVKWAHHHHHDYSFEKIDIEDEGHVVYKSAFGESVKYINTDKFEQGDFECSFGAMKIYFDHAVMKNESAIVKLEVAFAGVELFVPKNWKVENRTSVFLGGVSEKNRAYESVTNTLTLVGDVSFGGVEIIYI
ncbi:LiaF transmembrane domain-containing protein [Cellulosilyticum sp. I15G10I2]|uniref:LiaF transmembrane domain-containing protein n=1 Tax=Cellulosilyticum sp. I15G10I2 TaxID=1892843 RepID=UPI00085BEF16|nr:LiaF domain-containing protein [Cellulosilyticum sp. I15G10I2]